MSFDLSKVVPELMNLRETVHNLKRVVGIPSAVIARWVSDAGSAEFHSLGGDGVVLICILGGTGTGKSTLLNQLIGEELSAASFRRTFTQGPIAAVRSEEQIPAQWLGVPHQVSSDLPAPGQAGALTIAKHESPDWARVVLIDTPDVDGDTATHHEEADRTFRWSHVALFVVTPEKYQMPELLPYYRLAQRYGIPAIFVMNKCEEAQVLEDYARELSELGWPQTDPYCVPRDDAGYQAPVGLGLPELRNRLGGLKRSSAKDAAVGNRRRLEDLLGRLQDQILSPLRNERREALSVIASLRALRGPRGAVDVSPLTQQLQRRMQEKSVLYLMGPARVLERIRSVPSLLARLPRTAWDLMSGSSRPEAHVVSPQPQMPDFQVILMEQFAILQSQIDDLLRSGPLASWIETDSAYANARIASERAAQIAGEELSDLQKWLEQHWDKQPRDTRIVKKLLRILPGGEKLTPFSEAMPYLLVTSLLVWHPAGWVVSGAAALGVPVAADLLQEISNEVRSRTRETNRRMEERFDSLAREQIERVCSWIESRLVPLHQLERIERSRDEIADTLKLK